MAISLFIYRCISRYSFLAVSEVLGKYSAAHHWVVGRKLLDDCDEALEGLTAIFFITEPSVFVRRVIFVDNEIS